MGMPEKCKIGRFVVQKQSMSFNKDTKSFKKRHQGYSKLSGSESLPLLNYFPPKSIIHEKSAWLCRYLTLKSYPTALLDSIILVYLEESHVLGGSLALSIMWVHSSSKTLIPESFRPSCLASPFLKTLIRNIPLCLRPSYLAILWDTHSLRPSYYPAVNNGNPLKWMWKDAK